MLKKGRYLARVARTDADIRAAQALRCLTFGINDEKGGTDRDTFDEVCTHFVVEEVKTKRLVCCFRLLLLSDGSQIERSYSAQFYELSALDQFTGRMAEMGRFCIHPEARDPDVLRTAWAALTRFVDENGIEMLFGCSSFPGTNAETYLDAFAVLKERHLAPSSWLPKVKAPSVYRFAEKLRLHRPNTKVAMQRMPPLLRSYLLMGGWVSDHAVVDTQLNTLHVFTGVEIKAIPAERKRLLRMAAQ